MNNALRRKRGNLAALFDLIAKRIAGVILVVFDSDYWTRYMPELFAVFAFHQVGVAVL